jgi:hypothetical protein
MKSTAPTPSTRRPVRYLGARTFVVGLATTSALLVPTLAQAASPASTSVQVRHGSVARTSSICNKVSAASVSSIIGYKVPAGVAMTVKIKPTKANFEESGSDTSCTYGAVTSLATLLKAVTLSYETIAKPLTPAEMQESIAKTSAIAKFKFSTYGGLDVPGFYFSLTEAGITGQGITGVKNGTTYFSASAESKTISKSTLAALAKLAENL